MTDEAAARRGPAQTPDRHPSCDGIRVGDDDGGVAAGGRPGYSPGVDSTRNMSDYDEGEQPHVITYISSTIGLVDRIFTYGNLAIRAHTNAERLTFNSFSSSC